MFSPERHIQIDQEKFANGRSIQMLEGIEMSQLLPRSEQESLLASEEVSIYQIPRPRGTEYAVVFQPLTGRMLYERMRTLSQEDPGYWDVADDINLLVDNPKHNLNTYHMKRLGPLWEIYSESLSHQNDVYQSVSRAQHEAITQTQRIRETLSQVDGISNITSTLDTEADEIHEQIMGMLHGEIPPDAKLLKKMCQIKIRDLAVAREFKETGRVPKKISRQLREKITSMDPDDQAVLVLQVAREKMTPEYEVDGNEEYSDFKLTQTISEGLSNDTDVIVFKTAQGYFNAPRRGLLERAVPGPKGLRIFTTSSKDFVDITVNEEGRLVVDEDLIKKLEDLRKMHQIPYVLTVPVFRFYETHEGIQGVVFNEFGPDLPDEVVDSIAYHVDQTGLSSLPCQKEWISGMTGNATIVAAHPTIRQAKRDKIDRWSKVWHMKNISFADVTGDKLSPKERMQINGPVQAGVIALHASIQYPNVFEPFITQVKKLFK